MSQDETKSLVGSPGRHVAGAIMPSKPGEAAAGDKLLTIGVNQMEHEIQNDGMRLAQEELEASKAKYFDLYDTATVGLCEIGKDGMIRQTNQAAGLLLVSECNDLVREPFINFIHREDLPVYKRFSSQIEETGVSQFCELRLEPCGKEPLWVDIRGSWKIDENGEGEMRLAICDIHARKMLEDQTRQSQKMQAFGRLAGGVAHDFNNIIATILMQVDNLDLEPGHSRALSLGLQQIRNDALRAADLTRQLLTFSRKQVSQFLELDLNEVVRNMVKMSRRIVGDHISLEVQLAPAPMLTLADAGMLEQLMMSLLSNAMEAMPNGGQINVATEERTLSNEDAMHIPDGRPGRYGVLTIMDNGCGIAPEFLSQIFEPFFTTKEVGKGTGLGLATVYGIVQQHQGLLTVKSEVGIGTSIQIFLPASSARLVVPAAVTADKQSMGGRETILLVEDQASLRKLTGMLLEARGYQVLYAGDGVEALEVSGSHRGRIDLLLTDLQMPRGIGGVELADRLSETCGDLRIIFVSGGAVDTKGEGLCLSPTRVFVGKPIRPGVLLDVIRSCLDS